MTPPPTEGGLAFARVHFLRFCDLYQKGAWEAYTSLYQPLQEPIQPLKKDPRKFSSS